MNSDEKADVGPPPSAVSKQLGDHSAKLAPHYFRRHMPHFEGTGAPIFITFTTKCRWELPSEVRPLVMEHILHDHEKKMNLICAVIMPDHVHILYEPLQDTEGNRYTKTEIIGAIKSTSARSVNRALGHRGSVWQSESFDRVMRSAESVESKALYICDNPVRAGLCINADEYPHLWRSWMEGER